MPVILDARRGTSRDGAAGRALRAGVRRRVDDRAGGRLGAAELAPDELDAQAGAGDELRVGAVEVAAAERGGDLRRRAPLRGGRRDGLPAGSGRPCDGGAAVRPRGDDGTAEVAAGRQPRDAERPADRGLGDEDAAAWCPASRARSRTRGRAGRPRRRGRSSSRRPRRAVDRQRGGEGAGRAAAHEAQVAVGVDPGDDAVTAEADGRGRSAPATARRRGAAARSRARCRRCATTYDGACGSSTR